MMRARRLTRTVLSALALLAVASCTSTTVGTPAASSSTTPSAASDLGVPNCPRPDRKPSTETSVSAPGFVRSVTLAGHAVWVAVRGGQLAELDPFCGTTIASVDIGARLWPNPPTGAVPDFITLASDGRHTLWAIAELLNDGRPLDSAVVRVDTASATMTASRTLGTIGYSRTAQGLAVNGDFVWVADALSEGTAARLDPRTGAIASVIHTPAGDQSSSEDIAVDRRGLLWVPDGGGQALDVLDSTGVTITQIPLPDAQVGNPAIVPAGPVVWISGASLHLADENARTIMSTGPGALDLLASVGSTVWGVRLTPGNAVVHIAANGATVLAAYPVASETVSFAAEDHDLWRVDFDGVLHHIAV